MLLNFIKHNIKKIRNNLLKSGPLGHHKHHLKFKDKHISWQMWVKAFQWDTKEHSLPVHYKLSHTHLFPSNKEKMRNALAEQVLSKEMLHLMKVLVMILNT